jgi:hypothetical protein
MLVQEIPKFVLEPPHAVVRLLVSDVIPKGIQLRSAHRKRPIARLPREPARFAMVVVHPFRRVCLVEAHHVGDRSIRFEFGNQVKVIGHTADAEQDAAFVAGDSGHVFLKLIAEFFSDERFAIFGAKDDVEQQIVNVAAIGRVAPQ